jgi:DNA-binding NtrC family response regulator
MLKTLIVDDDKKLRSLLNSLLVEEGDAVTTCGDGSEAIGKCREEKFDLIITDLVMPGANGIEVLKEARKLHAHTLVILITGYASLETAIEAIREGAYDYITKPFKLEEFKIVVHNARERIALVIENHRLLQMLKEAYDQIGIAKMAMGAIEENAHSQSKLMESTQSPQRPFVSGRMLPDYYMENHLTFRSTFLSEIERLATLRREGFLSEEEFELCKLKLFKQVRH